MKVPVLVSRVCVEDFKVGVSVYQCYALNIPVLYSNNVIKKIQGGEVPWYVLFSVDIVLMIGK